MLENMQVEDIDRILELEKQLFSTPWKREDFIFELTQNPFAHYKVIKQDHCIIGYIGYWIKDIYVEITNVAVSKDYQKQGIGQQLVMGCIEDCMKQQATTFTLEVRVNNEAAIALYKKMGFKVATIRKNYYTDTNEDAYLMLKELTI